MPDVLVAIADDHKIFSQSLAMLIDAVSDFKLLFIASNGLDFLEQINSGKSLPHVALLDIDMPGMNGIELNKILHKKHPEIKVIMLSVHLEEQLITQVIEDGAASYLSKNCDKNDLIKAIRMVCEEGLYINQLTLKALTLSAKTKSKTVKEQKQLPSGLSQREIEVLQLICKEYSNTEIAQMLYISPRTVEGHRNNLLIKTGCRNSAGLVLFALKNNLFTVL